MNNSVKEIADFLLKQSEVSIIAHVNPDGDAIGSMASLGLALKKCGVKVKFFDCDRVNEKFSFIKCYDEFCVFDNESTLSDVLVVVDCATLERSGLLDFNVLEGKTIVNIDHHISDEPFGDYYFVNSLASANCENVYKVIKAMNVEIDSDIATALYLGISTDSGSFKFDAVTKDTHLVAASLIECGARCDLVRLNMYENMSMAKFNLQKYLYDHVDFFDDGKIAVSFFPKALLEETKADSADIDGIVNILKNISGVEVAMLFREREDGLKLSLRSKAYVDVNVLASSFGGGGHVRASGATIKMSYAEIIEQIIPRASELIAKGVQ